MMSDLSTISDFDDNDEDELQATEGNGGALMDPKSMVHSGMLLSLLHQVCFAYQEDSKKVDVMFRLICKEMSKLNLLPCQNAIDSFSSMQATYTNVFRQMMHATLQHLQEADAEPRLQSLPSTEQERTAVLLQMQSPLLRLPRLTKEDIIYSRTTRYETDFEELSLLGKGGFGRVYKVRSKLDQRCHAIKKIKLKPTNIDKSLKHVKEVQLLAGLNHPNVVRYNTSWVEAEPAGASRQHGQRSFQGGSRREPVAPMKCLSYSSSESPRSSSEQESSTTDKNRVKIQNIGIQSDLSPCIWKHNADASYLTQYAQQYPLTDSLASSPNQLSRSPSDSASTLVASPTTPTVHCCKDESPQARSIDSESPSNFRTEEANRSSSTHSSTSFSATTESSFNSWASTVTVSTSDVQTYHQMSYTSTDLFHEASCSQSEQRSSHKECRTTEVKTNLYEQDSWSESDLPFHDPASVDGSRDEEESSEFQICFETSRGEKQSDVVVCERNVKVTDKELGSASNTSSNPMNSSLKVAAATDRNKNAWALPREVKFGSFGSVLPSIGTAHNKLTAGPKIQSQCKIVSLDGTPDEEPKPKGPRMKRRHRSKSQDGMPDKPRPLSLVPFVNKFPVYSVYLYIQMQLCSNTLSDWLRDRNTKTRTDDVKNPLDVVSTGDNMYIFKQILDGTHYIHSQGVIHRDLKPKNIFLETSSGNVQVVIGDFGLAKEDFVANTVPPDHDIPNGVWAEAACHTTEVGTTTYASPEQLKTGSKYDCKSDMFSSGIILFEMFHPFATKMERAVEIQKVRSGRIPKAISDRWPVQCETIGQLTHCDSCHRPHAQEVLMGPLFLSKDEIIKDLRTKLSQKDAEIKILKQRLTEYEKL